MADRITALMFSRLALEDNYEQTWESWRHECNAEGKEIYYDMSNPTNHGVVDECGNDTTIQLGKYQTRPCTQHSAGHKCNPPRYGRITGFGA